jgi:hypothetical protein
MKKNLHLSKSLLRLGDIRLFQIEGFKIGEVFKLLMKESKPGLFHKMGSGAIHILPVNGFRKDFSAFFGSVAG